MQKNNFLKSSLILIIGSLITKIMGLIIRILFTRSIGSNGISLYTLIMPTYTLVVTICTFAMPITISKLISQGKIRSKIIMSQGLLIIFFISIITMISTIILSPFIAKYLLHEELVTPLLIASVLSMPNMAIACILKGYFIGKQNVIANTISNIFEQIIRIIFILFFLNYFVKISLINGIISYLLISVLTEGISILIFILLLPKGIKINIKDIKYDKDINNLIINDSIPLVTSKIIGSVGYFLEPIILSYILIKVGYSTSFFIREYGIYNAYSLSLLLLPSFLISSLCTALIPEISKLNSKRNYKLLKLRIKQILISSLLFGIFITIFVYLNSTTLLNLLYKTNLGTNYIKYLSIFFALFYLEAPLSAILQALNYSKYTLKITTTGVVIKLLSIIIFSLFKIGIYSLIIAEAINISYVVFKNIYKIKVITNKIKC